MDCFSGSEWKLAEENLLFSGRDRDKKRFHCLEEYLRAYSALAASKKIPQDKLDSLYNKTVALVHTLEERERWLSWPPENMGERAQDAQVKFKGILALIKVAKSRLDKLLVIEHFIHLTHAGGGVLLPRACDVSGIGYELAVEEVLNCLAGEENMQPAIALERSPEVIKQPWKFRYMHLFHGTTPEKAHKIAREGFSLGEDNKIWLTDNYYDAMSWARGGMVAIGISGYSLEQFGCEKTGGDMVLGERGLFLDPVRVSCSKWDNSLVDTIDVWLNTKKVKYGDVQELDHTEFDWTLISKYVKGNKAEFSPSTSFIEQYPEVLKRYPVGPEKKVDLEMGLRIPVPVAKGTSQVTGIKGKPGAFPTHLTMAEYERDWKPQGWKIIFIGPTATWRQEWGTWEAIREIVQNALDEAEAYQYGFDDMGFFISDAGRGVGVRDFLLGPPKLKEKWSRGKYGEGMKIGGLELVRAGYPVYIETVGKQIFIIFIEQEVEGKVETLAALWKEGGTDSGTNFHIINYQGDDFADRFAVNLPRKAIVARSPSLLSDPVLRYNQLITYDFTKQGVASEGGDSRIYARDIFMRYIKSPFSYNLWSFDLAPDRHAPASEQDMYNDMGRLWCFVNDVDYLKTFLKMVSEPPIIESTEGRNVSMNYLGYVQDGFGLGPGVTYASVLEKNAPAWQAAWDANFGDDSVLRTSDALDHIVQHLGYKSVSVSWSSKEALQKVIRSDAKLIMESQDRLREVEAIPDDKLTPLQLSVLKLARNIADSMTSSWSRTGGIRAAVIPAASDRTRTAGLYGRSTKEIFIAADQLNKGSNMIDVLIHELAHHTSKADDGIPQHYGEMSALAGKIVRNVADRYYDTIIKDPNFHW
jgi:hypothetical protein